MEASPSSTPGLKRSLSVWAAVGLSVALMAPSMAANINPQQTASAADRAVPLALVLFSFWGCCSSPTDPCACGHTTSMPVPSRRSSAPLGLITV